MQWHIYDTRASDPSSSRIWMSRARTSSAAGRRAQDAVSPQIASVSNALFAAVGVFLSACLANKRARRGLRICRNTPSGLSLRVRQHKQGERDGRSARIALGLSRTGKCCTRGPSPRSFLAATELPPDQCDTYLQSPQASAHFSERGNDVRPDMAASP
ncbi:hypothetical protein BV20DRAFT_778200 [Pilatotrama ljubarskyi]|nr:hypothetical protein BV20DRAFT_778200 [Pilatotrama ljubarskyi]